MKTTEKFVLFWDGPFSNWYPSQFMYHGVRFNCGEQFMMYTKAVLFNDIVSANEIMATSNPKLQKSIGRGIKNYNDKIWSERRKELVKVGLREKFSQNPKLRDQLLATGTRTLVEASPYDTIWGIGLSENDPNALDPSKWKGTNLLGEILTEIRDEFGTHCL